MGRGKKKAVGSSDSEALALALPVLGFTDSTHGNGNGDSAPSNCDNNGNASVQNSSVQTPQVTQVGEDTSEQPKLDEGFFEIESIRRKRVRKVFFLSFATGVTCLFSILRGFSFSYN